MISDWIIMNLADKRTVAEILSKHRLWAKRSQGQNFLVDRNVLNAIIETAEIKKDDLVLEVGPGLGVLTAELCKSAGKVLAVEIDENLIKILEENMKGYQNLRIIRQNILTFDIKRELKKYRKARYSVVANLPYNITSAALKYFLENKIKPQEMILMVQKEVGERICAAPGNMSLLSVSVQFYARPKIISVVKKDSFFPVPKVDSVILKITDLRYAPKSFDTKLFFQIVKAGFSARRKQLRNSLAGGLQIEGREAVSLLNQAGIPSIKRAQELSIDDWYRLYEAVKENK